MHIYKIQLYYCKLRLYDKDCLSTRRYLRFVKQELYVNISHLTRPIFEYNFEPIDEASLTVSLI